MLQESPEIGAKPKMTRLVTAALIPLLFVASLIAPSGAKAQTSKLARRDENAIRATIEAYRTAWLANDAKGVLKTFTDDAVLLPAHGASAVVGIAALEKYWFTPGGPPTIITELNISVDQVSGTPTMAFARGLDGVAWTVTQDGVTRRHSHPGTYLNVMRKLPDGSWRIQAHMWDDGPERVA
jgi:uncharacterized protein (TIGR02246 family)